MASTEPETLFEFTPEEEAELDARPIGEVFERMTDEQVRLRQALCRRMGEAGQTVPEFTAKSPAVRDALRNLDGGLFYIRTVDGNPQVRRIFGVMEEHNDESLRYLTVMAMMFMPSRTIDGIEMDDTVSVVENWSDDHCAIIKRMDRQYWPIFFDPLGIIMLDPE